ncbi:META domain-containing protein [Psychroserpens sp. XS_ASV72]|uniref:META domain-containing protein n=1 Tax=Psychroserpens sp. XS_ASV72 TaxID=3241293 RepID=UPI003515ECD6
MKHRALVFIATLTFFINSCANKEASKSDLIYNATWELEYISGPRIAFEGLFPEKKPTITFNKDTKKVEGTNSCNGYSAEFKIDEGTLYFGEPGPTTMMYCGQGENVFLDMMKKVNAYSFDADGKLNLIFDGVPIMRFKNIN